MPSNALPVHRLQLAATFSILLATAACPSSNTPAGEAGGSSGTGGSGAIAGSTAGSGGSSSPSDSPSPAESITPLAPNSFVFVRGKYREDTKTWMAQIWAYDLDNRTEKLVTDFGGTFPLSGVTGSVALSPDRRWVAFSGFYQPTSFIFEAHVRLLWKVSVDGKKFVRLTPPTDPRPMCSQAMSCSGPAQKMCESGRCMPHGWIYAHEAPAWTPDGTLVVFHITEVQCLQLLCMEYGLPLGMGKIAWTISAFLKDAQDSEVKLLTKPPGFEKCDTAYPRLSPDSKRIARFFDCGGNNGIVVSALDGSDALSYKIQNALKIAWKADGKAIYYGAIDGSSISLLDLEAKTTRPFVDAEAAIFEDLMGFLVSPDGRWLVFTSHNTKTGALDIQAIDTTDLTKPTAQLTTDNVSHL
jgi:Tol biopolymer transport system component